jgi:hypothetical protein
MFDRVGKLSYYQILGVRRESGAEQIEGACWHLWQRYRSKSTVALWREVKGQIDEMHDTLLDPGMRAAYDRYLAKVEATLGQRRAAPLLPQTAVSPAPVPAAVPTPRRDACKACYIGGVAAVLLFHALLEAHAPQTWDDLVTIGWLSVFCAGAVSGLAWTLNKFVLDGSRRSAGSDLLGV